MRFVNSSTPISAVGKAGIFGLLGLLVAAAYLNSLRNEFISDDLSIIVGNKAITHVESLPRLLTRDYWANYRGAHEAAPSQSSGLYRPLTLATYALNYAIGGLDPVGYHLMNLALHLLVTWLVYLLALRIGTEREAALVVAAIFAVHPLHTEAVTQVVGRAELLMSLGVLGALWFALTGHRLLSLASFAGGLFSKEQAVVLPVLLILHDICMNRDFSAGEGGKRWWTRVKPELWKYGAYLLVLAAYLVIRAKILGGMPLPPLSPVENPLTSLEWGPRLLTVVKVAGYYVGLFIWPGSLLADYSGDAIPAARSLFQPAVLWGILAWGGLAAVAGWSFTRDPRWCFSAALTGFTFLPVSNLVVPIGTIMGERLFYLPSVGLCLLAGLGWERIMRLSRAGYFRLAALAILTILCLALTARTVLRNRDWRDAETLFRGAVAMAPQNAKAYVYLGGALQMRGRYAQALEAYDSAARLHPDYVRTDPYFNSQRGILLLKLGRTAEAVEAFEQAATQDPNWGAIRIDLGLAYAMAGDNGRAEAALRQALSITPESPQVHSSLSLILNEQGRHQEALAAAEAALQREPTHLWAQFNRAVALEGLGRLDEATLGYERVVARNPAPDGLRAFEEAKERLADLRARRPRPSLCPPGLAGCR